MANSLNAAVSLWTSMTVCSCDTAPSLYPVGGLMFLVSQPGEALALLSPGLLRYFPGLSYDHQPRECLAYISAPMRDIKQWFFTASA